MALKYIYTKTEDGQQVAKWNVFFYIESVATNNLVEAITTAADRKQTMIANKIFEVCDLQITKSPNYEQKKCELLLWLTNKAMKELQRGFEFAYQVHETRGAVGRPTKQTSK